MYKIENTFLNIFLLEWKWKIKRKKMIILGIYKTMEKWNNWFIDWHNLNSYQIISEYNIDFLAISMRSLEKHLDFWR